jgi:hypothetical protein
VDVRIRALGFLEPETPEESVRARAHPARGKDDVFSLSPGAIDDIDQELGADPLVLMIGSDLDLAHLHAILRFGQLDHADGLAVDLDHLDPPSPPGLGKVSLVSALIPTTPRCVE